MITPPQIIHGQIVRTDGNGEPVSTVPAVAVYTDELQGIMGWPGYEVTDGVWTFTLAVENDGAVSCVGAQAGPSADWEGDWSERVIGEPIAGTGGAFVPVAVEYGETMDLQRMYEHVAMGVLCAFALFFMLRIAGSFMEEFQKLRWW